MAVEVRRQCGYRKIGGTYLVGDGAGFACGRFPIRLMPCPLCEHEPRFTRGLQRIRPKQILHAAPVCASGDPVRCEWCPLGKVLEVETAGLVWVGDAFYTPGTFATEAAMFGVSKRIPGQIPKWFQIGTTWVFFAHPSTITEMCRPCEGSGVQDRPAAADLPGLSPCEECAGRGHILRPGVFFAMRPTHIERIIPDTMPEAARADLRAQGFRLVEVPADDPDHAPGKWRERKHPFRRDDDD
jgi:hypothetical protein